MIIITIIKVMRTRYSLQRELIYDTVLSDETHPTAEEVYHRLKPIHKHLSLGTVYRNLHELTNEGKLNKILVDGSVVHYDADVIPHYHSVCVGCGGIGDIRDYVKEIDDLLSNIKCGKVLGHNVVLNILCSKCSSEN